MIKTDDILIREQESAFNILNGTASDGNVGERKASLLGETSDSGIVAMFLARDEGAIGMADTLYGSRMTAMAQRITGLRSDAEEIVNDVWLKAWNAIPPHEPYGYLLAFLLNLTRKASLDRVRYQSRKKRNVPLAEISEELESCLTDPVDVESAVFGRQIEEYINDFLRTLPKQNRVIFVRRYYFAEPTEVIAKKLRMTNGSVRTSLSRTRKSLRAYLEEREVTI